MIMDSYLRAADEAENNMTDGVWAVPGDDRTFNVRKALKMSQELGRPLNDAEMEVLYREAAERDAKRE